MAYIIIDAQGYYGTYATVYSRHETLDAAKKKLGRRRDRYVTTDGGYAETHQPGSYIHRQFASAYERAE